VQLAKGNPLAHELVTSYHQSFRGESVKQMARFVLQGNMAELVRCGPAFGAFPREDRSMDILSRVQARDSVRKPIVVFPNRQTSSLPPIEFENYADKFSKLLIQPNPQFFAERGIATDEPAEAIETLAWHLGVLGLGICLDLEHWDEKTTSGLRSPHWEDAFPLLASRGLINEIHIGPNRTDILPDNSGTELRNILAGNGLKTTIGEQLTIIKDNLPENSTFPYTVIEMTAPQAQQAYEQPLTARGSNSESDLLHIHRNLVIAVRQMVAA
jgi:hypothetical protein